MKNQKEVVRFFSGQDEVDVTPDLMKELEASGEYSMEDMEKFVKMGLNKFNTRRRTFTEEPTFYPNA